MNLGLCEWVVIAFGIFWLFGWMYCAHTLFTDDFQNFANKMINPQLAYNSYPLLYDKEWMRRVGLEATAPTVPASEQKNIIIVFPYRNREAHYHKFMNHFASIKRPEWNVTFYVIEQNNAEDFRRAWLLNIGIAEASKKHRKETCLVTHDIDMLPSNKIDYAWCDRPTQTCSELSCENYSVPYLTYTGGTVEATITDWEKINGFTNEARGWGGEDDELYQRFRLNNLIEKNSALRRASKGNGVCICLNDEKHTERKRNLYKLNEVASKVFRMQKGSNEWKNDGLNNLKYKIIKKWTDDYNTIWFRVDEVEEDSYLEADILLKFPLPRYKILNGKSVFAGMAASPHDLF